MGTSKIVAIPSFSIHIFKTMLVRILLFFSTFTIFMSIVVGHCCGSCDNTCPCYGKPGGCDLLAGDDSSSCPPSNSHFCCAPQKCGDCNFVCCECSCCCSGADGKEIIIPALQKWKSMDRNNDLKVDLEELSFYLGNGSSTWTKHTYFHAKLTKLFMDTGDSNKNGQIDPWEVDSELRYLVDSEEL